MFDRKMSNHLLEVSILYKLDCFISINLFNFTRQASLGVSGGETDQRFQSTSSDGLSLELYISLINQIKTN